MLSACRSRGGRPLLAFLSSFNARLRARFPQIIGQDAKNRGKLEQVPRDGVFVPSWGRAGGDLPLAAVLRLPGRGHPLSLLARLAPHLPYVRRYARALTGDQTTGDHYVRVALEALAAGERVLDPNLTPRVALYHVFHAIWCTSGAQLEAPQDDDGYSAADDTTRRLM